MAVTKIKELSLEELPKLDTIRHNPYGLVYDGAITENVEGQVNIHPIRYVLEGLTIAANVYTPAGYDPEKSYPAVCVAHPNGGVKEQVAGLFAQNLAAAGYITLAADASHQGGSEGEPHMLDVPRKRVEDIHGMCDAISLFPGVDADRIGVLGICGGGGYTIKCAQTEKRFKAVATLSMFNSGVVRKNGFMDSQIDTIQERIHEAAEARAREAKGEEPALTPNMCTALTPEQADKLPYDLYRDGYYYYGVNYPHPYSTFSYTVSSLLDLASFDAVQGCELIDQPLLMMAGSAADTFYMTEHVFAACTDTQDKELFLVPGAHHIETYFKPEYVKQEVAKVTEFFNAKL